MGFFMGLVSGGSVSLSVGVHCAAGPRTWVSFMQIDVSWGQSQQGCATTKMLNYVPS